MRRSDLAKALAREHPERSTDEIDKMTAAFFDEIMQSLVDGKRVELRGLGSFTTRSRDCSKARNPSTGVTTNLGERRMLYFRTSKAMATRLNKSNA
jgi:integration host factor subunit beta